MSVLLENGDVVHFDRGVRLSSRFDLYDAGVSAQLIQIMLPAHLVGHGATVFARTCHF